MKFDHLIAEKWFGQNQTSRTGSATLNLKYCNLTTELPNDLVVSLVRSWQAICQVTGASPIIC